MSHLSKLLKNPCIVVCLIGMPAAGKTKLGKWLAMVLGFHFVDIDDCIEDDCGGEKLKDIVARFKREGHPEKFTELEERIALQVLNNLSSSTIIATGGSMVYCKKAMEQFKVHSYVVYLQASLRVIKKRIANDPDDRGIVYEPGETLTDVYLRRMPLYEKWADHTVITNKHRIKAAEELARHIISICAGTALVD